MAAGYRAFHPDHGNTSGHILPVPEKYFAFRYPAEVFGAGCGNADGTHSLCPYRTVRFECKTGQQAGSAFNFPVDVYFAGMDCFDCLKNSLVLIISRKERGERKEKIRYTILVIIKL
jgi:hypothetical protein